MEHFFSILILSAIAVLVFLAVRSLRKKGAAGGCSGNCDGCPHACSHGAPVSGEDRREEVSGEDRREEVSGEDRREDTFPS